MNAGGQHGQAVLPNRARAGRKARPLVGALLLLLVGVTASVRSDSSGQNDSAEAVTQADSSSLTLPIVLRPVPQQPPVGVTGDDYLDKKPPRATRGLDLVVAGWSYNCMECHKLFPARWHYDDRPFIEHRDVQLNHGNNRFCLNCHHSANRNAFVDYDGTEIPTAEVVTLCAKCHGPIYRDWQAGVHGRENGFWRASVGSKTKLLCIQCHDPHNPRFKGMKPLPPLRYPPRAAHPPSPTLTTVTSAPER